MILIMIKLVMMMMVKLVKLIKLVNQKGSEKHFAIRLREVPKLQLAFPLPSKQVEKEFVENCVKAANNVNKWTKEYFDKSKSQ